MKKNILVFLFLVVFYPFSFSQGLVKLKMADKHFENYEYPYALKYYLSLAEQNINSNHTTRRVAQCYYYMGEFKDAAQWYEKVLLQDDLTPDDLFKYSKVLRQNEDYQKADSIMFKHYNMVSNKNQEERYKSTVGIIGTLKKEPKRCTLENLNLNTAASNFGAFYHNNEIIFTSAAEKNIFIKRMFVRNMKKSPYLNIYHIDKDKLDSAELVKTYPRIINSKFHDGPGTFNLDSSKFFFTRNNHYRFTFKKGKNGLKIYSVENKDGKWENLQEVSFDDETYSIGHPAFSPDGKKLYFVSDMPDGFGGTDIYYVNVNSDGTFGTPVNMGGKINTDGNEMFPFVSNENIFFFSSDGHVGLGGLDIFYVQPDYKGDYEKVKNAGIPMNSIADDFSFYIDDDNQKGFISSNRLGGRGDDDIYSFELLRPFKQQYIVKGEIKDKLNQLPLNEVVVLLRNKKGEIIQQITTDKRGLFEFEVEPDQDYKIECNKEEYSQYKKAVSTKDMGEESVVFIPVFLEKNTLTLKGLILDKKTNKPLSDVDVKLINTKTGNEELAIITRSDGAFSLPIEKIKLNDLISYRIILNKEGYLGKKLIYTKRIKKYGIISLQDELDVSLTKVEKGLDLAKVIDIEPIYFDLGKWNIRPDAAIELDKIVQVMKENPTMVIELGSHTDSRGSASSNARLSDKRAKSSASYIVSKGIDKSRITGKGYGESRLINRCKDGVKCSEEEHQENRRTEFIIVKN